MGFKIGDLVEYALCPGVYEIVDISYPSYFPPLYRIKGGVIGDVEAYASELTPHLPYQQKPKSLANGCECGAWATKWPDDHMHFCPKFKGVSI